MSAALLLLAAVTPDLAFEAYGTCAQAAAATYKGPADTIEAVVGRIQTVCASDQSALLEVAPDKRQAAEWVRMTTTLAVTEHVPGLKSAGTEVTGAQTSPAPVAVVSRYPKLDAYRQCVDERAAKVQAELPYASVDAITKEAIGECEKALKPAADEAVAEMGQPGLRQQVTMDFRRRETAKLTDRIGGQRAGKREVAK